MSRSENSLPGVAAKFTVAKVSSSGIEATFWKTRSAVTKTSAALPFALTAISSHCQFGRKGRSAPAILSAATDTFSALPFSARRTTSKEEATPGSSLSPSFFGSAFFGMVELRKRKEKSTSKRLPFGSAIPSANTSEARLARTFSSYALFQIGSLPTDMPFVSVTPGALSA